MPRIRLAVCAATGLFALTLSGCASSGSGGGTSPSAATVPSTPAPVTVTQTVHATSSKPAAPPTTAPPKQPKRHRPVQASGAWVMPNEIGRSLQHAQDDVQRASGDPLFVSHSHDMVEDRFQILDSDWKVCTQNVAPGSKLGPTAHIDFGVVKLDESC